MNRAPQVQVGVVAQDRLRLVGLQTILEEGGGMMPHALDIEEAFTAGDLDAVLLDSSCVEDLSEVLAQFRRESPAAKVIVMGKRFDFKQVQDVMAAGAKGYLEDTANESEIRMAMQAVLEGSVWAPRKVMARLIETGGVTYEPSEGNTKLAQQMTQRELQVLQLLMNGRTNRQIAEAMGVEPVTIKAHLGRMLRKAGATNRVELTLKAMLGGSPSTAEAS